MRRRGWWSGLGGVLHRTSAGARSASASGYDAGRVRRGGGPDGQLLREQPLRQHEQPGLLRRQQELARRNDRPPGHGGGHQPGRHRLLERQRHRRAVHRHGLERLGLGRQADGAVEQRAATSTAAGTEPGATRARASMPVQRRASDRPLRSPRASIRDRRTRMLGLGLRRVRGRAGSLGRRRNAPTPAGAAASEPEPAATSTATPGSWRAIGMTATTSASPRRPERRRLDPPPVIDDVVLEKTEVCAGEENLVTVIAHTTNETDSVLHYRHRRAHGQAYPVPIMLWTRRRRGTCSASTSVTVFGTQQRATTVPLPQLRGEGLPPDLHRASVAAALRSNTWADFDFTGERRRLYSPRRPRHGPAARRVRSPQVPKPFKRRLRSTGRSATARRPRRWRPWWSTTTRAAEQDALYSYFVIGVTHPRREGRVRLPGGRRCALQQPAHSSRCPEGDRRAPHRAGPALPRARTPTAR